VSALYMSASVFSGHIPIAIAHPLWLADFSTLRALASRQAETARSSSPPHTYAHLCPPYHYISLYLRYVHLPRHPITVIAVSLSLAILVGSLGAVTGLLSGLPTQLDIDRIAAKKAIKSLTPINAVSETRGGVGFTCP
jgi:NAD-dependent oxidoreductase involved in siderophore biosynthesis